MSWYVCLILAAITFISAVTFALVRLKTKYKSGRVLTPSRILFAGVVVSAVFLFIPIYIIEFKANSCDWFETIFISIHNMIRLFVVDGDFDFVVKNVVGVSATIFKIYSAFFAVLFVLAPLLTFGFVLSFFKNLSAHKRYVCNFFNDVFIFSELNEKSLALANSLHDNDKRRLVVFTDVFEREEEASYELVERAKELGAICFKKDIATIDFSFHSKNSELNFFAIGEQQSENMNQALKLVEKLKYRENTNLYVFSTAIESEMLLVNAFNTENDGESKNDNPIKIHVRRINEVQSLITRNLYEAGYEKIFKTAIDDGTEDKKINAVVVGMGKHGIEMVKALSWFCQMDGYLPQIDAFELDDKAEEKFISNCPELMMYSGKLDIKGETRYTINIHDNIDADSVEFEQKIASLPQTTYVFIALGNDEKNISAAVKLRTLFERMGIKPIIQSIVYNTDKKEALNGIANFSGQKYDIDFIGDIKSSYSESVILDSDVEALALKRHLKWGEESAFWQYNYNYKSSVASAIHYQMKKLCGIAGIEKDPKDRTENELWGIRILEHRRWNAYMRSEGYVYSGSIEKSSRNNLAKMHNCLVPFDKLPINEQEKDDD